MLLELSKLVHGVRHLFAVGQLDCQFEFFGVSDWHPEVMSHVEVRIWCDESLEALCWRLSIEWLGRPNEQLCVSCRIILERIFNLVLRWSAIYQVSRVQQSNEVLFEDVVNVLAFVNAENVPVSADGQVRSRCV